MGREEAQAKYQYIFIIPRLNDSDEEFSMCIRESGHPAIGGRGHHATRRTSQIR